MSDQPSGLAEKLELNTELRLLAQKAATCCRGTTLVRLATAIAELEKEIHDLGGTIALPATPANANATFTTAVSGSNSQIETTALLALSPTNLEESIVTTQSGNPNLWSTLLAAAVSVLTTTFKGAIVSLFNPLLQQYKFVPLLGQFFELFDPVLKQLYPSLPANGIYQVAEEVAQIVAAGALTPDEITQFANFALSKFDLVTGVNNVAAPVSVLAPTAVSGNIAQAVANVQAAQAKAGVVSAVSAQPVLVPAAMVPQPVSTNAADLGGVVSVGLQQTPVPTPQTVSVPLSQIQ